MTVQEALKILNGETREDALYIYDREDRPYILAEAERMSIQALEEVEQYRALGTVEELKEAREKQVAKKPIIDEEMKAIEVHYWNCPSCKTRYGTGTDMIELQHCHVCGQALKWGAENEM